MKSLIRELLIKWHGYRLTKTSGPVLGYHALKLSTYVRQRDSKTIRRMESKRGLR